MFGLSGSRTRSRSTGRSQSQSSSFSFGASDSVQGAQSSSISGGTSVGGSESLNSARGTSRQSVAFDDVFSRLFSNAENTAASLDPSILTESANQLFSGGLDFIGGLGGDAGTAFMENRLRDAGNLEAAQLDALRGDVSNFLSDDLLPQITSEAVASGALGGGRQGVAEGAAIGEALDAFTRGAVDIRTRNQSQLDALAQGVASQNINAAQVALAGSPALAGIAEQGFGAQLQADQFLAGILGGPQILTQADNISSGSSSSFSTAEDFARAFSDSFGRSSSRDRAGSQSTSSSRTDSTSTSRSAGIGFGG